MAVPYPGCGPCGRLGACPRPGPSRGPALSPLPIRSRACTAAIAASAPAGKTDIAGGEPQTAIAVDALSAPGHRDHREHARFVGDGAVMIHVDGDAASILSFHGSRLRQCGRTRVESGERQSGSFSRKMLLNHPPPNIRKICRQQALITRLYSRPAHVQLQIITKSNAVAFSFHGWAGEIRELYG